MLRSGPVFQTLVLLTLPNLISLGSSAVVSIAETAYVGKIGVSALGGIALAFPVFMLMQMLSAGAMGGTISGAISRALGAGNRDMALGFALSGFAITLIFGLLLAGLVRAFGAQIYAALGGNGSVLQEALAYSNAAAWGLPAIWLANGFSSILRGSGVMSVPATTLLGAGIGQVVIGGALGLGIGPFPQLGIAGVAIGQVVAYWVAAAVLLFYLRTDRVAVGLRFDLAALQPSYATALLKVGAIAMLSPLLSVVSVLILTRIIASFGPEVLAGYGIGVRLEFLLIPIAFSVGVAALPMVGTAIGANDVDRARKITWTSGGLVFLAVGLIGLGAILVPGLWVDLFTEVAAVRQAAYDYLTIAGFGYGFFGVALCFYFASQGAGRIGGVIAAQSLRTVIIALGGWWLLASSASASGLFMLSMVAMVATGVGTVLVVKLSKWG